jgi:hypothetical protein
MGCQATRPLLRPTGWTCDGTDLITFMLATVEGVSLPVVAPSWAQEQIMARPEASAYHPQPFVGGDHPHLSVIDPMTDREALEALLARFGLPPYTGPIDHKPPNPGASQVHLVAGEGVVVGYNGFRATFEFDSAGKFQSLGLWE